MSVSYSWRAGICIGAGFLLAILFCQQFILPGLALAAPAEALAGQLRPTPTPTFTPLPTATSTPATTPTATAAPTQPPAPEPPPAADPDLTLQSDLTSLAAGQKATFTVLAVNPGPGWAQEVVVSVDFSSGLKPLSAASSQGAASITGNQVIVPVGTMPGGQRVTITIQAQASDAPANATFTVQARLTAANGIVRQSQAVTLRTISWEMPQTGFAIPLAGLGLAALLLIARSLRRR